MTASQPIQGSCFSEALRASESWLANGVTRTLSGLSKDGSDLFSRKLKALCEMAFLEFCVTTRPSMDVRAALRLVLRGMWESGELLMLARYNLVHANLFLPLASAALAALETTTDQRCDTQLLAGLAARQRKERLPFRSLDLLHGLYKLTGNRRFWEDLIRRASFGCLGDVRNPHDVDPADDYAVTHTIFYVTDFGQQPWPNSLTHRDMVSEVLDVLSTKAEEERNFDLLGEYVLSRQMLGLCGKRYDQELALLMEGAELHGFWPGPADLGEVLNGKTSSLEEAAFFHHYHTTLVVREALLRAEVTE